MAKFRLSHVTNSSSSSFIICFARIADKEKAQKIIDKYSLDVFDAKGVDEEKSWCGELACSDFAVIYGVDKVLSAYPDDEFIIIRDCNEAYEDEDGEVEYDYDFRMNEAINSIVEDNGFADIDIAEGEGRDG